MVTPLLPLQMEDVVVRKRGKHILGPISLQISGEGPTVVIGPNGCGKTTLLRTMHGLEKTRSGEVKWNCDVLLARKKQSFVFQAPIVLRRTVIENVAYPLRLNGVSRSEALAKSEEWLDRIGIADAAKLEAAYLSGGEKQKLAVARALITSPDVVFLDEPTANLDGKSTREIESIVQDASNNGIKVIMTTHDMGQARRLGGEVLFLYRGKLHEQASSKSFYTSPETREAKVFLSGEILE